MVLSEQIWKKPGKKTQQMHSGTQMTSDSPHAQGVDTLPVKGCAQRERYPMPDVKVFTMITGREVRMLVAKCSRVHNIKRVQIKV